MDCGINGMKTVKEIYRFRNGLSDGLETQWYENGQRESGETG